MSDTPSRWRPLVDGPRATQLRAHLDEIAVALEPAAATASLCDGAAGRALFFGYLAHSWPDERYGEIAARHLEHAVALAMEQPGSQLLHTGLTGVAWTIEHLQGKFIGPDDDDPNQAVDELLAELLTTTPWLGHYDLIAGLVGFGLYALERAARPSGRRCLELIVARLAELAEARDGGVTWFTRPELLDDLARPRHPHGYFNLGVAHGVAGVIALLGACCQAGVAAATARPLLDGAVRWLLAQRRADPASSFAYWVEPDVAPLPARTAWCYGDPGVATALLWAARAVGEASWAEAALAIGLTAATRAGIDDGVVDAGLCHGSAGLLHLYNRLYQSSGEEGFAAAARAQLERTLAHRKPGVGVAGYRSWSMLPNRPPGTLGWLDDASLLNGACGVGLALLSAITPIEPRWDRVLAAAAPPTWSS